MRTPPRVLKRHRGSGRNSIEHGAMSSRTNLYAVDACLAESPQIFIAMTCQGSIPKSGPAARISQFLS